MIPKHTTSLICRRSDNSKFKEEVGDKVLEGRRMLQLSLSHIEKKM